MTVPAHNFLPRYPTPNALTGQRYLWEWKQVRAADLRPKDVYTIVAPQNGTAVATFTVVSAQTTSSARELTTVTIAGREHPVSVFADQLVYVQVPVAIQEVPE